MVLEKDSAILGYPGEVSRGLDADHHEVCKYDSPQDHRYISIRNALKSIIHAADQSWAKECKFLIPDGFFFQHGLWLLGSDPT